MPRFSDLSSYREKELEHENLDVAYTEANKNLQQVETILTNTKAQLEVKREEVQGLLHSLPRLAPPGIY